EFDALEASSTFAPTAADETQGLSYLEILGEENPTPTVNTPSAEVKPADTLDDKPLENFFDEHRALLRQIAGNPSASITEHYQSLKWSAGRGNRVKNQLLEMGLVTSERQKSNNGRPKEILTLTQKGKSLL